MKNTFLLATCFGLLALLPVASLRAQETAAPAASKLDFGNSASSTITTKAWGALQSKSYDDAIAYTAKCIELYKAKAIEMQKALTEPTTDKEQTHAQWALNDVGTCYFIQAKAYEGKGMQKEALDSYKVLASDLAYAQCWDAKGWFWKPADAAKDSLKAKEFDSLK